MARHAEFTSDAARIGKILRSGIETKAKRVAEAWRKGIVEVMEDSEKAGERYYYPGLGWTRASLPGRPPAIQTEAYKDSLQVRRVGRGPSWAVGTDEERGEWLQKGTENMAPRPHFEEGYRRNKGEIEREMNRPITARERHFGV